MMIFLVFFGEGFTHVWWFSGLLTHCLLLWVEGTGSLLYLDYFVLEDPDPLVGANDVVFQLLK